MRTKEITICLTGGLGNQLFQLAFGLSRKADKVLIDSSLGKPRKTETVPDLFLFRFSNLVFLQNKQKESRLFFQKVAGFLLRIGVQYKGVVWAKLLYRARLFLGGISLSIYFRRVLMPKVCQGVGYFEPKNSKNELAIGYFQTYKFLRQENVESIMMEIEPIHQSDKLKNYINDAEQRRPVFLHLRLSDYLTEEKFGTCSSEYYESAIKKLKAEEREIWVFSDDLNLARKRLESTKLRNVKFVEDSSLSPAEILHLYRHGADFVIANSTFSWWGAALRMKRDTRVIAPKPWFINMPEPSDLIPEDWMRVEAKLE